MKIVLNACVTRQNLYSTGFKAILDYSARNRILIETIFARCLGSYSTHNNAMLNEEDMRYFERLRSGYPYVVRDLDNNYAKRGCPAVKEVLYITPYGDVCPCPYSHVVLGNVRDQNLRDIRFNGLSSQWYGSYHDECLTAHNRIFMEQYVYRLHRRICG